jgi:gentisate 1,2-dioxygenase
MRVRVTYRSRGWRRVRPVFHAWLEGDYMVVVGGMRFRCTLKRYVFVVTWHGRKYTYYRSTVDCRSCRLLCETLRRYRPAEVEVVKPLQLKL